MDGRIGRWVGAVAVLCCAGARALAAPDTWDPRLNEICGLQLVDVASQVASGQGYWRLISGTYEDQTQSGGNHHIYVKALDINGQPITDQKFFMTYPYNTTSINENVCVQTGSPGWNCALTKGGGIDNYFGNSPMWAACAANACHWAFNSFISETSSPRGYVGKSDKVIGMGMTNPRATPCGEHVNFRLIYRWTIKSGSGGSITGTVRDGAANPLTGATITASPGGQSTTSAANGTYTLANLSPGTYAVTATKSGYLSQTQSNIQVVAGQVATVNFTLAVSGTSGTISGIIRDSSTTNPIAGATVQTTSGGYSTTTNSGGGYALTNVAAGTYTVQASASGYSTGSQANVTVTAGGTTTINISLTPATPSGIVNRGFEGGFYNDPDSEHQTANSWTKFVQAGAPKHAPSPTIRNSGSYSQSFYEAGYITGLYQTANNGIIGHLYRGSVHVYGFNTNVFFKVGIDPTGGIDPAGSNIVWSPQAAPGASWTQIAVEVTAASTSLTLFLKAQNSQTINLPAYFDDVDLVDLGVAPAPTTGKITGTVKDSSNAVVAGAAVQTGSGGFNTTTDSFGNYEFTGLAPGTYSITVAKIGFVTQTTSNITVVAGQTSTVNFTLAASQNVAGFLNGGFEGGFYNNPDVDHRVGNSWTLFTQSGASKSGENGTTKHGGSWSQSFYEGPYTSGIRQQVTGVGIGNRYRGSVWVLCANISVTFRVGLDPTGGTDPAGANIVWSSPVAPGNNWTQILTEIVSANSSITFFVKAVNPLSASINSYIDDALLENLGGGGAPPTTGTLSGSVKDNANNPISAATVQTNSGGFSTTTDSNGLYSLTSATPGSYNVTASKSGFNSQTQNGITVTAGVVTTADFVLTPISGPTTGTISGTVRDANNAAVAGATVATSAGGYSSTTDAGGSYSLANVTAGTYSVTASKSGYNSQVQSGVVVVAGASTTVNFTLTSSAPVSLANPGFENGFYNDPNADHLSGNSWSQFTLSGFSKSAGHAGIKRGGTWSQSFYEGPYVSGLRQQVSATAGRMYRGAIYVYGASSSVKFQVGLDPTGGTSATSAAIVWSSEATPGTTWTQIQAEAQAAASTITLFVKATNPLTANLTAYLDDASITDLGAGPATGTVNGTVKDSSNAAISGATIQTSSGGYSTASDANGNYTLTNVAAGTYSVTASKAGFDPQTQTGVSVVGSQITTLNFTLSPAQPPTSGTISGTVRDAGNTAIPGAVVQTNTGGYSTATDATGNYSLTNVTPGTYSVTASKTGYTSGTQSGVVVTAGQTTTVSFNLVVQPPFSGLLNGGFESGFRNDPDADHQVGNSWNRFSLVGASKSGGNATFKNGGTWSQSFWEASYTAGIYQAVTGATVGNRYTASVWVRGDSADVRFWIGIDPNGGTNPANADFIPTPATPGTTWTQISRQVQAGSSTITVFIKVQNTVIANRNAFMDDASLTDNGPPPGSRPVLTAAVSRKTHGGSPGVDRDIDVMSGATECRSGQLAGPTGSLLIVATFNQAVSLLNGGNSAVTSSAGQVVAVVGEGTTTLQVTLAGVPHVGKFTMAFPGVADAAAPSSTTASQSTLCVRVCAGDYNNNGRTNFMDFQAIKAAGLINTATASSTARADFDLNGVINYADFYGIKSAGILDSPAASCP